MTEFEKMRSGQLFSSLDPDLCALHAKTLALGARLRGPGSSEEKRALFRDLIPSLPDTADIEPPFFCDTGSGTELEEHVHIGPGCVFLDTGIIHIGAGTDIGPGCLISTPHHPLDAELRKQEVQWARHVYIGAHCRLGARVIVCPGVTIGDGCVIAPGSVVTRDIPPYSFASGCPARVTGTLPTPEERKAGDAKGAQDGVDSAADGTVRELSGSLQVLAPHMNGYKGRYADLLPHAQDGVIMPPVTCTRGKGICIGEKSFLNFNACLQDQTDIRIGRHTLIGPCCCLAAKALAGCTREPEGSEAAKGADISIGDDCWLGGGVTVWPGVHIGDRCIVAAGSVVCEDVPADSLIAGHPARVIRRLEAVEKDPRLKRCPEESCLSEFAKMRSGLLYDFDKEELRAMGYRAKELCCALQTAPNEAQRDILHELIPGLPDTAVIFPPFHCDFGHGLKLGAHVFFNADCVCLDSALITIGEHSIFGPGCQLYTPQHPLSFEARRKTEEYALPITIGRNCWFGAGCIVCPGVTIGDNCVIAAGSVVVHDVPDNVLIAGRPAVIRRRLA